MGLQIEPQTATHPQSSAWRYAEVQPKQVSPRHTGMEHTLASLFGASDSDELKRAAELVLGPYSFGVGVCAGMIKNPVGGVLELLELYRTFILAEVYHQLHQPLSWRALLPGLLPGPSFSLGVRALMALGVISEKDLEEAHQERAQILRQLEDIIRNPVEFLGSMPGKIRDEYVAKWSRFQALARQTDLESQYEAGEVFGDLLMEVLLTIAGLLSGVGAAARIAAKAPQLVKLAGIVKKAKPKRPTGGGGGAGAATGAAPDAPQPAKAAPKLAPEPASDANPRAPEPGFKKPLASDLANVDAGGVKAVRVRQGTNGKVAVIGRSMGRLVNPYGAELRKQGYDVEVFSGKNVPESAQRDWDDAIALKKEKFGPDAQLDDSEMMQNEMWSANEDWAQKLVRDDYTVVDVGSPPDVRVSPFYEMEKATIFGGPK